MKLKVPFKAVPNFKKKTSWIAVSVCFASSLLTIALPQAVAQNNGDDESRTIERGNIAVTKSVQSSPLGGTSIVYAKTRISDAESSSKNANVSTSATALPTLADTKLPTTTKVESEHVRLPENVSATTIAETDHTHKQGERFNQTTPNDAEVDANGIAVKTQVINSPMAGTSTVYSRTKVNDAPVTVKQMKSAETVTKKPSKSTPVVSELQAEIDAKPVQKGIKVVAEQTDAEKALIKKFQAKKALSKNFAGEQLAYNQKSTMLEEAELGLTPTEKVIPTPKPNRQASTKPKQPTIEDIIIDKLEFNRANMLDVARALADMSGMNFVATEEAAKKNVTVFLQKISVKNALEAITKNSGVWYRQDKNSNTFRIMSTEEYQRDLVVYREDTTKVFNLFNHNPVLIATAVRDLYGERVILSFGSEYDDFNTGTFNGGGGNQGNNQGNRNNRNGAGGGGGSPGGAALGGGQNSLRRPITSGNATTNALRTNGNGQTNTFDEKISGTSSNGAITEKLSADQLSRLESAAQFDANGNLVVSDAIRGITGAQQPIYITISRQQNMMIVRTSDGAAVKEIENLVKAMDKPTAQVLLEMQILEVDVGDAYNQLFSFGAFSKNGKQAARAFADDKLSGTGKFVYSFVDNLINVRLELLQKTNKAKIVSSPVLLASNNRTARLFVGEERLLIRGATLTDPVLGANGQVVTPGRITYETEIRNIGNSLNITPKINADGTVTLGLFQDTSTVNPGAVAFPPLISTSGTVFNFSVDSVDTANIEGVVAAKDGLTVAIGGLIRTSVSKDESKIPVLGDLPIVGNLFKDKVESASRKELILLITPHIMSTPADTDDVSRDAIEPLTDQQW